MDSLEAFNLTSFRAVVQRRKTGFARWVPAIAAYLTAVLAGSAATAQTGAKPPETLDCDIWVVRNALSSPNAWDQSLAAVERLGCRRIYLQVSGRWDAYFPSRVFGAPGTSPFAPGWEDPFGRAVADAHARGLEVHAWVNAMLAWSAPDPPTSDHVFRSHPDWFVTDRSRRSMRALTRAELDRRGLAGEGWFLDPAVMGVRTELRRFLLEVVLRYPVDGVHLDYIRFPSGWAPPGGAETVSYLVGLIHDDLVQVRPGVRLSAAVLPIPEEARRTFGQDWTVWLARGIIDEVVPMVYRRDAGTVRGIVASYPSGVPRERLRVGMRLDLISPAEVRRAAEALAQQGVGGIALFSHNLLLEDRSWRAVEGFLPGVGGP